MQLNIAEQSSSITFAANDVGNDGRLVYPMPSTGKNNGKTVYAHVSNGACDRNHMSPEVEKTSSPQLACGQDSFTTPSVYKTVDIPVGGKSVWPMENLRVSETSGQAGMTPPLTPVSTDSEEESVDDEPCFCIFPFAPPSSRRGAGLVRVWSMTKDHNLTERTVPYEDDISSQYSSSTGGFYEHRDKTIDCSSRTVGSSIRSSMGDVGLALFSPLDTEFFGELSEEELQKRQQKEKVEVADIVTTPCDIVSEEDDDEPLPRVEDFIPVNLDQEPPHVLEEFPAILSKSMMQQISNRGLPLTAKLMKWSRVYSLTRDGDNFQTMIQNCARYHHTVVVIKTTSGDILGGYADSPWRKQEGFQMGGSFYGSGQAFLFATNPALGADDADLKEQDLSSSLPYIHIYHWTGENSYSQVCDEDGGRIAMGGGGDFGLLVEDNFIIGSSGHCSTFGNPPLTSEGDGFDVLDMEVYGLRTSLI